MGRQGRGKAEAAGATTSASEMGGSVGLRLLVLIAGAVLMGMEVVGSRVLAPHFGNSVFVWGSLITVVLTALAGGYYFGGHLADRRPSFALLAAICAGAGLLVLAVPVIGHPICRGLRELGLGERSGPLVGSLFLFLGPSLLLGMVSPFSVRLASRSVDSIGRVAGTLYALSTVGSIAGTLLTTFVLIPTFGTAAIFKGLGATLVLVSIVASVLARRAGGATVVLVAAAIAGLVAPAAPADVLQPGETLTWHGESAYHDIRVVDRGGSQRFLKFDRFYEGGIELRPPYRTLQPYTDFFELAFLVTPQIERALFIGTGAGLGPRSFLAENPAMWIDVVDVDREVLEVAERLFHFELTSPRVTTHAVDGRQFLNSSTDLYDCIVVDAFTVGGRVPTHLVTREFYELCRAHLTAGGVLVVNANGHFGDGGSLIYRSVLGTLQTAFPAVYSFATRPRNEPQAVILVAVPAGEPLPPQEWRRRAANFTMKSRLTQTTIAEMAAALVWPSPDPGPAPRFTDDYVPIETMPLPF